MMRFEHGKTGSKGRGYRGRTRRGGAKSEGPNDVSIRPSPTVPALSGNFMKKIQDGVAAKGGIAKKLFDMGVRAGMARFGNVHDRPPVLRRAVNFIPHKLADLIVFSKVRQAFGSDIQFCVGGGALLDRKQQEFLKAIGVPIYQGYGLSEAAPVISSNTPFAHRIGTSGKVAPSVQCHILQEDGSECRMSETGQLTRAGSPHSGYLPRSRYWTAISPRRTG